MEINLELDPNKAGKAEITNGICPACRQSPTTIIGFEFTKITGLIIFTLFTTQSAICCIPCAQNHRLRTTIWNCTLGILSIFGIIWNLYNLVRWLFRKNKRVENDKEVLLLFKEQYKIELNRSDLSPIKLAEMAQKFNENHKETGFVSILEVLEVLF